MPIKSYRELKVWQKSIDLVVESYRLSTLLPRSEAYGLVAQIRRSGTSIAANIAEGYGRLHRGNYLYHLSVAQGSLTELQTHFHIADRLKYLTAADLETVNELCDHVGRMLTSLIRSLR